MVQNLEGWYETREVGEGIWAIDEQGTNTMYLIRGDEKCLLVDTGWGASNLPGLVKTLSTLPLIVVNSHGHLDHTGALSGLLRSMNLRAGSRDWPADSLARVYEK